MSVKRSVLVVVTGLIVMGSSFFIASKATSSHYEPGVLLHDFAALGVVGSVEDLSKGRCRAEIAVYNWINLSPTFPRLEIPQQGDWYDVIGTGSVCDALTVAMAATSSHISFRIGRDALASDWYFSEPPGPALGCGGLEIDWTPPPRS